MPWVGALLLRPQAWRKAEKAETVSGTLTTRSPKRGTSPVWSLTPLARGWPLTSRSRAMPLYSIGSSLGFCTRSLTMKRISMPCPGRFQADQVDTQRIALAEGAAGAQQDAQAQGRQQAAEVRRQAHGFSSPSRMCAHGATAAEFAAQPIRLRQWTKDMPMPTRVLRGLVAALPTVPRRLLGLRSVQRGDRPPARRARLRQTRLRQLHPVQDLPGDALRQLLRPRPGEGNAAVYDALVGVGLLRRDGDSYDLTPAGREDYKPESKAFCYSSGFDVSVRSVDPAKPDDYGPAVERAGWSPSRSSHAK